MSKHTGKNSGTTGNGNGKLRSIKGGKGNGSGDGGNTFTPTSTSTSTSGTDTGSTPPTVLGPTKVIDFQSVRAQRNLDNRRGVERFFLRHMIDVYCDLDGGTQQLPLEIVEVSETGCSFRLPMDKTEKLPRDTTGAFLPLQVRFYFSRDSYLRIGLNVVNANREIGTQGAAMRYGCKIDETFASTAAYKQFVRFMEQFAQHAMRDMRNAGAY